MNQEDATVLASVIQNMGYQAEVYDDYSGRGMFGGTTAGVVTDMSKELAESAAEDMLDDPEPFQDLRQDSMGLSLILY
jgi:hypothetical protein